jgi:glycosyltransferase involved in cell wall biosynthesis
VTAPLVPALRGLLDGLGAGLVLAGGTLSVVARSARRRSAPPGSTPGLMVLDGAYSLATARERGIEYSFTSRDLGGWFGHVWHVHPLVGADEREASPRRHGRHETVELSAEHTVIEGHPSLFRPASRWPLLGFALAQVALARQLAAVLATGRVSVLRVGDPYYLGLLGLSLARLYRLPFVVRVNGNYDEIYEAVGRLAYPRLFRRRSVEKRIDRAVLRRADLVAAPNRNNLGFALSNGAKADRAVVLPYGALLDPVHFTEPAERGGPPSDLRSRGTDYLVAVTRLEPVKRTDDVLRVLAGLRTAHPRLRAVIIGDGSQLPALQRRAAELGVEDAVEFAGSRPQPWIARTMAGSVAVLAPSAGRALVEASLSGSPIVAYDLDWHGEYIVPEQTGFLVSAGDAEGMAATVARLLDDRTFAARVGNAARASALVSMDPATLVAAERTTYEALLAGANR